MALGWYYLNYHKVAYLSVTFIKPGNAVLGVSEHFILLLLFYVVENIENE